MGQVNTGGSLDRREVVKTLLWDRGDLLVVSGLGSPTYDVFAAGDDDNNYYLWVAMGSAAMIGLGLAMSQPNPKVLVVTGDGEILMGLGALATISIQKPSNLSIVVLDNGYYGETGMQLSRTGKGIEMHKIADACEFDCALRIDDMEAVEKLRQRIHGVHALNFAVVKVSSEEQFRTIPSRDGVFIKNRFRTSLGFSPN